jgi:hypothetical protein
MTGCSAQQTHVEVLASVRADAPGPAWAAEAGDYRILERSVFNPGYHVVVAPISDSSSTERTLFDEVMPVYSISGLNPRQLNDLADRFRKKSEVSLGLLWMRQTGRARTEIIAAAAGAAERFADDPKGTRKILVILSTGFEQSSVVNMADSSQNLKTQTWPVIRHLAKSDMLPRLNGVEVCMGSISSGLHGWADSPQYRRIHGFWSALFNVAGARLVGYGPSLPARCVSAVGG